MSTAKKKYNLTPESAEDMANLYNETDKMFYTQIKAIKDNFKDNKLQQFVALNNILTTSFGFEQAIDRVLTVLRALKEDPKIKEVYKDMSAEQLVADLGYTFSTLTPNLDDLAKDVSNVWEKIKDDTITVKDLFDIGEEKGEFKLKDEE